MATTSITTTAYNSALPPSQESPNTVPATSKGTGNQTQSPPSQTGESIRLAARQGTFTSQTSGVAPSYLQANLIVLPIRYAADFRLLCQRNPVPCPLLAESARPGQWDALKSHVPGVTGAQVARDIDLRRDFPRYMVYQDGKPVDERAECVDVVAEWTAEHVAFLIGCSFTFEAALEVAGLVPPHVLHGRNVPMYQTGLPLCAAGVFKGATYVVSMRMYRAADVERVRDVTRPFVATHGEPIDWGWDAVRRLGITDIARPEYGDCPVLLDGTPVTAEPGAGETDKVVPVFWGCGVTPQQAVRQAGLQGTVLAHAPGHMLVLDLRDWDILAEES